MLQKNGEINGFGAIDLETSSGRWEKVPMYVPKSIKKVIAVTSQSDILLRCKKMEQWLHGGGIMWVKQLCRNLLVMFFQL